MIVANKVGDDCGFDDDDNEVDVFWRGGEQGFPKAAKVTLAQQIIQLTAERYKATRGAATQQDLHAIH